MSLECRFDWKLTASRPFVWDVSEKREELRFDWAPGDCSNIQTPAGCWAAACLLSAFNSLTVSIQAAKSIRNLFEIWWDLTRVNKMLINSIKLPKIWIGCLESVSWLVCVILAAVAVACCVCSFSLPPPLDWITNWNVFIKLWMIWTKPVKHE